jgi:hypothetical protein
MLKPVKPLIHARGTITSADSTNFGCVLSGDDYLDRMLKKLNSKTNKARLLKSSNLIYKSQID